MIPVRDIVPAPTAPALTLVLIVLVAGTVVAGGGGLVLAGAHGLLLWLFGNTVEDRLGRDRLTLFLVVCGGTAWLAQALGSPDAGLALAVAGGVVSGVAGAYLFAYPMSRILTLIPVPPWVAEIPAPVLLPPWVGLQILAGAALWGPLAAFLSGAVAFRVLRRGERERPEWWSR